MEDREDAFTFPFSLELDVFDEKCLLPESES
jgi:hypothetical protein